MSGWTSVHVLLPKPPLGLILKSPLLLVLVLSVLLLMPTLGLISKLPLLHVLAVLLLSPMLWVLPLLRIR